MRRLWLAIVLGVVFGLGMGTIPGPTNAPEGLRMPLTPITQAGATQTTFAVYSPLLSQLPLLIAGLAIGVLVAVPAFLVAKRRA